MKTKSFQTGTWDTEWTNLAGDCSTHGTATSFGKDRFSLLCVGPDRTLDLKYRRGERWGPSQLGKWEDLGPFLTSAPALDSGGDERVDVVGYGIESGSDGQLFPMCFKRYLDDGSDWGDWKDCWGSFKGDPAVASLGTNRTSYFGVGVDGAMRHWEQEQRRRLENTTEAIASQAGPSQHPREFSIPENLGGNFESAPYILATEGGRLDVVAVGVDDRLKHRARVNDVWADDWDDLGGYFNSAPLAVSIDSKTVAVFGLGPDASSVLFGVMSAAVSASDANSLPVVVERLTE